MFSPSTVILDCGSSRTALGVFQVTRGRLCCVAHAQETFAAPAESDTQWLEATRAALLALRPQFPRVGPVGLVLPGHQALIKLIPVPQAAPRQRKKILHCAARQHLPSALEEVVWDGTVVGAHDQVHDVLLAAAKLEVIESLCTIVQEAGFSPQFVLPSSLATLAGYRLTCPASSGSSLVLSLGARSTSLLLFGSGICAVRLLSFGGNQLTRQRAEREACELWEAEERKLASGDMSRATDDTEAFAARLVQEIGRTIDTPSRPFEAARPERILLTGGGARLSGLRSALASRLNLPVEHLSLGAALGCVGRSEAPAAAPELLEITDLIGAAATQLLPDQPVLNLLPPSRCSDLRNRRRLPWVLATALLLVLALIPPILHEHDLVTEARIRRAKLEKALGPLRMQADNNAADLRQIAACRQEVVQLQSLRDHRTSWLRLLADLQSGLGQVENAWLDSLQVVPAPTTAPLQLTLKGRLLSRAMLHSPAGRETASRLRALFQAIEQMPGLTVAPKGRHFDHSQSGITRFEFIVVVDPSHLL